MASILVIEDDELLRMEVVELLEDHDHQLWSAATGEEALGLAIPDPTWELVVTDVRLPGRYQGPEVVEQLRPKVHQALVQRWHASSDPDRKKSLERQARTPLPFLIMTGFASESVPQQAARLKACDYIYKPFAATELLRSVTRSLQRSQALHNSEKILGFVAGLRQGWARWRFQQLDEQVSKSRQDCWQQYYVLIRSGVLKLTGRSLWNQLEGLERALLQGQRQPEAYAQLQKEILGLQARPKMQTPKSNQGIEPDLYNRFHQRVEKGEVEDHHFFLACTALLAEEDERSQKPELGEAFSRCWA